MIHTSVPRRTSPRSTPIRKAPILALAACFGGSLAAAGCGSSAGGAGGHASTSASGTGGSTISTGTLAGSSSSSGAGGGMTCPPGMTYGGGETLVTTGFSVTAKIVDETGAPVVGQPLYICGLNICSGKGMTQAGGVATITASAAMMKPAFKFGDAVSYAEMAIPLTMKTNDFTMGGTMLLATANLANKPGAALTPGTSATSGDVTIAIPAGATVGIDTLTYTTSDSEKLRTAGIPLANVGPILDPVMAGGAPADFKLLYGLAPAETTVCPAAQVTVALPHVSQTPNDLGWAPGTAVEFWIMTIDTGQTYAPYAGWARMSDGTVSADGTTVSTVDGQGFIFLESFAIRLKQ
jgi:hypothetical protein